MQSNHKLVQGEVPSIALINPKFKDNLGKILRLASCYGMSQVWYTGDRISLEDKERLPREERMKGFKDSTLVQYDRPFDCFPDDVVPIGVEVRENSESLFDFIHPLNALYVFGPEDGEIPQVTRTHLHRFVVIPVRHCLNLATAVATILWDRQYKLYQQGLVQPTTPIAWENRGGIWRNADVE